MKTKNAPAISNDHKTTKRSISTPPVVSDSEKSALTTAIQDFPAPTAPKKSKKWLIFTIILAGIIAIGVIALVVLFKYRDHVREERQKEYARQEAAMIAETFNFTIVPGETIFDIQKNLENIGYSKSEITEAFSADYDYDFLTSRPEGASLEGYLLGETHEFYKTDTVKDILSKFLDHTATVITEQDLEAKYSAQGLTLHEGIILASIIQKESPTKDMPTVAQIFLSRIRAGWFLGSDVTVSYALDLEDPDRTIYTDNLAALHIDSCYNTRYVVTGLPCGAISNPGISALLAVANPSDTSYLYFLTGDDGMMYYSYTESEHNSNIYRHCQILCQAQL